MSAVVHRILAKALVRAHVRATIDIGASDGVERPADGAAPTAFRIWKAGENATSKGTHKFTRQSAADLMTEQVVRGNLYSIDVDHLSLSDVAPPEARKAVGWHRLAVRETANGPELWAVDVEWTDSVKAGLEKSPPEWRYFSPAYDVARDSGEVVGYLNTALTNNPATYQVTALATRGEETQPLVLATRAADKEPPMKFEDILAALKAAAEGDDEAQAKKAKAALAALEGDDDKKSDEEEKKDSEGSDDEKKEAKKASDDDGKKDDEEEKKDSVVTSLDAKAIEKLVDAKLQAIADDNERDRLLASRKDVGEKLTTALKAKPLAMVREVLDAIPVSAKRNPAADLTIKATHGAGQSDRVTSMLDPKEKAKLDERMGLTRRKDCVVHEGNKTFFHAMTREQAKAALAAKGDK